MPASYTYNDAIGDAIRVVAKAADDSGDERCFKLYISLVSKLQQLKRPTRRKRTQLNDNA